MKSSEGGQRDIKEYLTKSVIALADHMQFSA
jgi:hypothetical protein